MKKSNPVLSCVFVFLSSLIALISFEIVLFITMLVLGILGAVLNSHVLFILSCIIIILIAASFVISILIGCTNLTVSQCPNKWFALFVGVIIFVLFIALIITTDTPPADSFMPDNVFDIPSIIYDIPMVIYGLAVAIYGFFSGETEN